VGALYASTAPAASTRAFARVTYVSVFTNDLQFGRPVESAYGALRDKRRGWICASTGSAVVELQWGIAPRAPVQG